MLFLFFFSWASATSPAVGSPPPALASVSTIPTLTPAPGATVPGSDSAPAVVAATTLPPSLLCAPSPTPINEQFRILFGRNASAAEVAHYAAIIRRGVQVSFFEPYPLYPPYNFRPYVGVSCAHFGARTADPATAGIPFQDSVTGPDGTSNHAEWMKQAADDGQIVIALYRTYLCSLPSPTELQPYLKIYQSRRAETGTEGFAPTAALAVAQTLKEKMLSLKKTPCFDLVADILFHVVGRPPVELGCNYAAPNPPPVDTPDLGFPGSVNSCYWLWMLANGRLSPNDLLHGIRSTKEATARNENPTCYAKLALSGRYEPQFSPFRLNPLNAIGRVVKEQNDPHAVGEYITLLYRLFLRRIPQCREARGLTVDCHAPGVAVNELANEVAAYAGGDPTVFLAGIADRITNPVNSANALPAYAQYGGYREYKTSCGLR